MIKGLHRGGVRAIISKCMLSHFVLRDKDPHLYETPGEKIDV